MNTLHRNIAPFSAQARSSEPPLESRPQEEALRETNNAVQVFRIASLLQTSLDAEEVLRLFAQQVTLLVPFDGMSYHNEAQGLEVRLGTRGRHSFSAGLSVDGQPLGDVRFTRRSRYAEDELVTLENLLTTLVYPLRNALMYRDALRSAHKDPLTGVSNRAALDATLHREMELARRHGSELSVIVLDIDRFKAINDRYGHAVGDEALKAVAHCVEECIRRSDMLFRYGGEEFVILLSNTGEEGAVRLAQRIRRAIETLQCMIEGERVPVTASFGVAILQPDENEESLFKRADDALYSAKETGRNRVCSG